MKIEKTNLGYKIYTKRFFGSKEYLKIKTTSLGIKEIIEDLIFDSKLEAQTYIDYKQGEIKDLRLFAVKSQLTKILNEAKIDPFLFNWADLWCANGIWGVALSQLTSKKVTLVDITMYSYEEPFWTKEDSLIEFKKVDTGKEKLPEEINAVFLRSTIGTSSIEKIFEINPQIQIALIVPEGLNSNEFMPFKKELAIIKQYFKIYEKKDLKSGFGVKGSHSSHISINKYFPLIIGKHRI